MLNATPHMGPAGPWHFASTQPCGRFDLRELDLERDTAMLHDWVSRPYARYWGMQDMSVAQVREVYAEIVARAHVRVLVGALEHAPPPAFLTECYLPHLDPLAAHYDARPDDRGLHILVAPPPAAPIPGFTRAAFATVLELLFSDPAAARIVVEPDVRNHKIRAINRAFGFRELRTLELPASSAGPAKTAMLSICTRDDLRRALESR